MIRLYGALPKNTEAQVIGKQLLRSGTSIGAHYREASRARSDAEFVSKIGVALQELEESGYWLELLVDAGIIESDKLAALLQETDELVAILTTIALKVKRNVGAKSVREAPPDYWPSNCFPAILDALEKQETQTGDYETEN